MAEETNQNMEMETEIAEVADTNATELPESLFEEAESAPDTTAEDNSTEDKAEGGADTKAEPAVEETPKQQMLKVKYLGEEREITIEEAVTLAQKGMNYDHVVSERDSFRENAELIKRCAKANGLSVEQYIAALENNSQKAALNDELAHIEDEYPDLPEDAMEELARFRIEKRTRELAEAEAEQNQRAMDARTKPWRDFIKEFPGVTVKDIPETVIKEIDGGRTPVEAYLKHENEELRAKIKTAEQTGMNKVRSIGSAKGDADEKGKDSFLEGFLST